MYRAPIGCWAGRNAASGRNGQTRDGAGDLIANIEFAPGRFTGRRHASVRSVSFLEADRHPSPFSCLIASRGGDFLRTEPLQKTESEHCGSCRELTENLLGKESRSNTIYGKHFQGCEKKQR